MAGDFCSRLRLTNVSEDELGILFAALGFRSKTVSPMLRLGGKKYHGLGAVDVELVEVQQRYPEQLWCQTDDIASFAARLAENALREPERRSAWNDLHGVEDEEIEGQTQAGSTLEG